MTSYSPWVFYAGHRKWAGDKRFCFAMRAEAEANLAAIRGRRPDVLETRIVEYDWKPQFVWDFERNEAYPLRSPLHPDDARKDIWRNRVK